MKKIFSLLIICLLFVAGCGKEEKKEIKEDGKEELKEETKIEEKVDIIDLESNARPYAVVINNYPDAVKVQTGLNDAYMVYEFPVEGGMTRSLAFYKDKETAKIGTVRSARHNFLDYVMEHDAIFVHFGWSFYAQDQIAQYGINNINGLVDAPFWRENPEGLAYEHTAYTSLVECAKAAKNKGYKLTTDKNIPVNYSVEEIILSDGEVANKININYSYSYKVEFKYNEQTKLYERYVNGKKHTDYFTKESFSTKNILVLKTEFSYAEGNYYLDIHNTGTGSGYYITNGYFKKITWEKKDRKSQTKYKYEDGTELIINDGNTYVMFRSSDQSLNIS